MAKKVVVQFDGACFGNPGPMGIGVALYSGGKLVKSVSLGIGHGTNNIAEYTAALRGLDEARKIGASEVVVQGDSQLIIKQLHGEWKVKDRKLQALHVRVLKLASQFQHVRYEWIGREKNAVADALSKKGAMS